MIPGCPLTTSPEDVDSNLITPEWIHGVVLGGMSVRRKRVAAPQLPRFLWDRVVDCSWVGGGRGRTRGLSSSLLRGEQRSWSGAERTRRSSTQPSGDGPRCSQRNNPISFLLESFNTRPKLLLDACVYLVWLSYLPINGILTIQIRFLHLKTVAPRGVFESAGPICKIT